MGIKTGIIPTYLMFFAVSISFVTFSPTVKVVILNICVSIVSGALWYWAKDTGKKKDLTTALKKIVMACISGSIMALFTIEIFVKNEYPIMSVGLAMVAGIGGEGFILAIVATISNIIEKGSDIIYVRLTGRKVEDSITPDDKEKNNE